MKNGESGCFGLADVIITICVTINLCNFFVTEMVLNRKLGRVSRLFFGLAEWFHNIPYALFTDYIQLNVNKLKSKSSITVMEFTLFHWYHCSSASKHYTHDKMIASRSFVSLFP